MTRIVEGVFLEAINTCSGSQLADKEVFWLMKYFLPHGKN